MKNDNSKKETVEQDHTCSICLDVFYKPIILSLCGHHFCENCLNESAILTEHRRCPLCRSIFEMQHVRPETELWAYIQKAYPQAVRQKQSQIKERVMVSLIIGNSTRVLNVAEDNRYEWQLYVKSPNGSDTLAKYVESVEVELHQTFHPNRILYKVKNNNPIKLKRVGWGTFRIGIKVEWKGSYQEKESQFHHDLQFEPVSERTTHAFLTLK